VRHILNQNNLDLLRETKRMEKLLKEREDEIPEELEAYYQWAIHACEGLRSRVEQNLKFLERPEDDILQNIHSRTQGLVRAFRLFNQFRATPILRTQDSDRLCLKLLQWLHHVHPQVQSLPIAIGDGQPSILVGDPGSFIRKPVFYRVPSTIQRGLLYLPLLFHEIGHQLYSIHKPEMDSLVRDLQLEIRSSLMPAVRRDDRQDQRERERRNIIVETWYEWTQELFCDAVGFSIGGAAYLQAFSLYMRMQGRGQFHEPPESLEHRSHPVAWIRVQFLADRARQEGLSSEAETLESNWSQVAESLDVQEDYFGFYETSYLPSVHKTIDHMLVEANPRQFPDNDRRTNSNLSELVEYPAHLLNRAWELFLDEPSEYNEWEDRAIQAFLQSDLIEK